MHIQKTLLIAVIIMLFNKQYCTSNIPKTSFKTNIHPMVVLLNGNKKLDYSKESWYKKNVSYNPCSKIIEDLIESNNNLKQSNIRYSRLLTFCYGCIGFLVVLLIAGRILWVNHINKIHSIIDAT